MLRIQFDMTPATWQWWCFAVLALAMVMAMESDLRERRIPNLLVLLLLVAGLVLNVAGPDNGRAGPLDRFPGALGLAGAAGGAVTGLLVFLPLYLLRGMGAGDVKLMAGLGSVVGPMEAVNLALSILLAGGCLALLRMLWFRRSRLVLHQLAAVASGWQQGGAVFDPRVQSGDRMPYALAMAGGLLAYGIWRFSDGQPPLQF